MALSSLSRGALMGLNIIREDREIARAIAKQLREIADLVEKMGLYDGTIDVEDKADFKKGEEIELRTYTNVEIFLKIKRKS